MRRLIHDAAPEQQLRDMGNAAGMISLRQYGVRKVLAGDTSLEEVLRVTRDA